MLAGAAFAGALAPQRLPSHLVLQTRDGRGDELKETLPGIAVFRRPADRFDPRRDSIVRVEAARLATAKRWPASSKPLLAGPLAAATPPAESAAGKAGDAAVAFCLLPP